MESGEIQAARAKLIGDLIAAIEAAEGRNDQRAREVALAQLRLLVYGGDRS